MKKVKTAVEYEAFYTFSTKKRNLLKVAIDSENHDLIRTLFTKKNVNGISVEELEEEDLADGADEPDGPDDNDPPEPPDDGGDGNIR